MTTRLIIYHGGCFDGFTAAWIAKRRTSAWREAELLGARHGDPPPDVTGREVLVLDFSYPREQMIEMAAAAASLEVLDHHKTAEARLEGLDFAHFDMERSGAGMAWDFLVDPMARKGRPWWVDVVEDRDLWRMALPDTPAAMAYIASLPMTLESWDELDMTPAEGVLAGGRSIQRYVDQYGSKALAEQHSVVIAGHAVPVVNLPYMNCSEHLSRLLDQIPDAPFVASYFRRGDRRWQVSLRSRPDGLDVSEIASLFGGGGHRGAAGFDIGSLEDLQGPC